MEFFKQIEHLVSARIALVKMMFTVFKLEARLAGLSIFPLILTVCMLLIVLMSLWLCTSLLLGYGILLFSGNLLLSLLLVFFFNLCVLMGLAKYLTVNLKNMSFEKTRAYFSSNKSMDDEQLEKTAKSSNIDGGSAITATENGSNRE